MPNKNNKRAGPEAIYTSVHIGDHRADVAGLSAEERGVYESLRMAYGQRGSPLPNRPDELCRLAEAFTLRERQAVERVLEKRFYLDGDVWRSARCDAEVERIADLRAKRQSAARQRWNANALQVDMQSTCYPESSKPTTSKEDIDTSKAIYPPPSSKEEVEEEKIGSVPALNSAATTTTSPLPLTQPPSTQRRGIVGGVITPEYVRDLEARLAQDDDRRAHTRSTLRGQ